MPQMHRSFIAFVLWNRRSEANSPRIYIRAPVKIVISHELQKILQMRLVRLEPLLHDSPLLKKFGEPRHYYRIKHVDLEIKSISNIEAIEGNALHQGDFSDISVVAIIYISPIAHGQGVVDG
ncbi:hypothetical protein RRF57_011860 [Xylaria bambusicola]|uniref:Uncharacterized protein n=1 Tax=Xylaria bambusicola TaxID=326684 RepID=A0AAN7UVK3_9PEZI